MGNDFEFTGGVVGIDPSLTSTGFARIGADGEVKDVDTFGTKADYGPMPERWLVIVRGILKHIQPDDVVFIEDYAYGKATGSKKKGEKSDSSVITLAELGGVLKLSIYNRTKRFPLTVASTTLKAYLGDGKMKKDLMPKEIYKKLQIDCQTHDEYVALALADFGWMASGRPSRNGVAFQYEAKACKTVRDKVRKNPELFLGPNPKTSTQFKLLGITSN